MPSGAASGGGRGREAPHRSEPLLQVAVIALKTSIHVP